MVRKFVWIAVVAAVVGGTVLAAQESSSSLPAGQGKKTTGQNPADPNQTGQNPAGESPSSSNLSSDRSSSGAPGGAPEAVLAAEAALSKSDWKTAEEKLNVWLAAHPHDARALFDAGYAADAENRLEDALRLYQRAVEANPDSFEAHLSLGLLLARMNKPDQAHLELASATKLDAGEAGSAMKARAWRALARLDAADATNNNALAASSSDLLEALKLTPETEGDILLAATLAEDLNEPEEAEGAYKRLLAHDPKSPEANAGLAHLLIRQKKYAEAETLLRAALTNSPDDTALTAQLATVLAAEDKPEALPVLQKLHEAHPDQAAVTRMLAEVLAETGDAAGSDALYVSLLANDPANVELLVGHGQNLVRLGRFPEAFATFTKATEADGANVDAWSGLAFAASRTSRPDVAVHALTVRAKFAPDNASTYFLWATSYDALHQKQPAVSYYRKFLDAAAGKYANLEWQARQRLHLLEK